MHAISKHFSHPEHDAQLILQSLEQGRLERANAAYAQFIERSPEHNYVMRIER